MTVLFAPHSDDETLFAAFTLIAHQPSIVVCFSSERDYGDTAARMEETRAAERILTGKATAVQWHAKSRENLVNAMRVFDAKQAPERVWAPDLKSSHPQHVAVASAAAEVFPGRLTTYHTYDERGKVREGRLAEHGPDWTSRKLQALLCYQTQILHPRANQFFMDDLREYIGENI